MSATSIAFMFVLDDDSRVCLPEIPGVKGSDYINASFITVRKTFPLLTHKLFNLGL